MSYSRFKGRFLSTNKIDYVNYYICEPESDVEGIIQFAHGWIDYFERNIDLIHYFTSHGYIVCGCDFIGHNFAEHEESGDFKKKNAWTYLVQDMMKFHSYIHKNNPDLPVYIYGHGLGSLVVRMAMLQKNSFAGVILSGTSGKRHFCRRAELLSGIMKLSKGPSYHSASIEKLMDHSMNFRFLKEKDLKSWECSDPDNRHFNNMGADGKMFYSMGALRDMFHMLSTVSADSWYCRIDKKLPILLISGQDDPIGRFGKGIMEIEKRLKKHNCMVDMKLYPGMRHNLQDEIRREMVFDDILSFLHS